MSTADCGVFSERACRASGLTVIDRVIRVLKSTGASDEADTERDGLLSYASESHAAGAGLGLGFAIAASGNLRWFGAVYAGLIMGNRGDQWFSGSLLEDIRKEKQYFLGGLVAGAVLGLFARFAVRGVNVA